MTIPNSPEQKLIEAIAFLEKNRMHMENISDAFSTALIYLEYAILINQPVLDELAELREKAACLQNELNEGRARQWRTIHFYLADEIAKGWKFGIRCECPICTNVRNLLDPTILKQMIEQKERT